MDHNHDHAAMSAKASTAINHAQHMMQPQINPSSVHSGHGSHIKDMVMMVGGIRFTLISVI